MSSERAGVLGHLSGPPRERVVRAMGELVAEGGFGTVTLAGLTARAGVSRRTFYEQFADLEACFVEVLDEAWRHATGVVTRALDEGEAWQDGLRSALAALLVTFDSDPGRWRVALVDSLAAGPRVLEHRERRSAELRAVLSDLSRWPEVDPSEVPPLAFQGTYGAVLRVVEEHLAARTPETLLQKLGPLMGLVAAPYVGREEAERERELGSRFALAIVTGERQALPERSEPAGEEVEVPASLANPSATRARRCVLHLSAQPGASNREVAEAAGIAQKEQVSRLLSRLAKQGIAAKTSLGPGKRNEWRLTPYGEEVAAALGQGRGGAGSG